jgi:hypothetical protein
MNNAIQNLAEELLMDCSREYGFSGTEAIDRLSVKNISVYLKRFQECNEKTGLQIQLCTFEKPSITMTEKKIKKRGRPKKDSNAEQSSKKIDDKPNNKTNDREGDVVVKKRGRPKKEKKIIVSEEQKYEDDGIIEVEEDIFGTLIKR